MTINRSWFHRSMAAALLVLPVAVGCASAQKTSTANRPSQMASSKSTLPKKSAMAQKSASPMQSNGEVRQASAVGMRNQKPANYTPMGQ